MHVVNHDELLDLVNEHDEVISQEFRFKVYQEKSCNFRVINAFVVNDQKQVWIPIRSAHKKLFPLCLDASVGGHVASGEDYETAFRRETAEELNIDISNVSYKFLTKLTPHEDHMSAFMHLYVIFSNETPAYNKNDFIDFLWISILDLKDMLQSGRPAKGDLLRLVQALEQFI